MVHEGVWNRDSQAALQNADSHFDVSGAARNGIRLVGCGVVESRPLWEEVGPIHLGAGERDETPPHPNAIFLVASYSMHFCKIPAPRHHSAGAASFIHRAAALTRKPQPAFFHGFPWGIKEMDASAAVSFISKRNVSNPVVKASVSL